MYQNKTPYFIPIHSSEEIFFKVTKVEYLRNAYETAIQRGSVIRFTSAEDVFLSLIDNQTENAIFAGKG